MGLGNCGATRAVFNWISDGRNVSLPLRDSPRHGRNGCRSLSLPNGGDPAIAMAGAAEPAAVVQTIANRGRAGESRGILAVLVELLGGFAVMLGAYVRAVAIPMAVVLLVAMFTVHLPYSFSSIKLVAVTAAGAQFGPPGYETVLLYLACLAALNRFATRARNRLGGILKTFFGNDSDPMCNLPGHEMTFPLAHPQFFGAATWTENCCRR
jgi:uncharacterized membrane protein YphA (DoxX/SURF4 family)